MLHEALSVSAGPLLACRGGEQHSEAPPEEPIFCYLRENLLFSCHSKVSPAPRGRAEPAQTLAVVFVQKGSTVASSVCFPSWTRHVCLSQAASTEHGAPTPQSGSGGGSQHPWDGAGWHHGCGVLRDTAPACGDTRPTASSVGGARPGAVGVPRAPILTPRATHPTPKGAGRARPGSQTINSPRSPLLHVTAVTQSRLPLSPSYLRAGGINNSPCLAAILPQREKHLQTK